MYVRYCKLMNNKQLEPIKHFVSSTIARLVADLLGVYRNTATRFFIHLRRKILLLNKSAKFYEEIELDKSYETCRKIQFQDS